MTREEGAALDRHLTTPPASCEEDGHSWKYCGRDSEGNAYFKCRRCGLESEE